MLILGAGFAGLELSARLSESLGDEVRVTLIDRNDSFTFGFAKLEVMFGRRTAADVALPYSEVSMPGVEFRRESVTAIDAEARRVETDGGSYEADILAIAMGARYDLEATPGFAAGGHEYYSVAGAERMARRDPRLRLGPDPDRHPRPALQVPARPLRGGAAAARPLHRARQPRRR